MSEEPPKGTEPTIRQLMMPKDTNALGTIFGGVILSQIDQAAAIAAHRYHHGRVVTVAMDEIEFKKPVFVGDVVSFPRETVVHFWLTFFDYFWTLAPTSGTKVYF